MYCIKCGKEIENNESKKLCKECYEKEHPTQVQTIKQGDIKKNYGLAQGIVSLVLSIISIVIIVVGFFITTVANAVRIAALEGRENAQIRGFTVEGVGISGTLVAILIVIGVVVGLIALGCVITSLCLSINGLKKSEKAKEANVSYKASKIVNIIATSFSGISFFIVVVFFIVALVFQTVIEFIKAFI